jgi:hypothetical protein
MLPRPGHRAGPLQEHSVLERRKQTGSFYTPREIVEYMVDESLIAYLKPSSHARPAGVVTAWWVHFAALRNDCALPRR